MQIKHFLLLPMIIVSIALCLITGASAFATAQIPVYQLHVRIYPEHHQLVATARIQIPAGKAVLTSNDALTINKFLINGSETRFPKGSPYSLPADNQTKTIDMEYTAAFSNTTADEPAAAGTMPSANAISDTGVVLLHDWYPVLNSPCRYKLTVEIDAAFDAVSESEGTIISPGAGLKTIMFDFPHPLDCITLVAGKYVTKAGTIHNTTIKTFLFAEDSALADSYIAYTKHYIELYESMLGPFPYKTFSIVENRFQTGYSFPTYTLLGSQVIRLPFIVETSLGHEILHQWFGNLVYVDDAQGNWAEGLTTYLADHWYQQLKGSGAEYRKKLLIDYANYVSPDQDIPLQNFKSPDSLAHRAIGYGKCAMVFNMLRLKLGDEIFFKGLRDFIAAHQHRDATWHDLQGSFTAAGAKELKGFFTQWLSRKGAPSFTMAHARVSFRDNSFLLSIDVLQDGEPYRVSIPARVVTEQGDEHCTITIDSAAVHYETVCSGRPLKIILDEQYNVMRRLSDKELPPVMSAFIGDKQSMVIYPEQQEKIYRDTVTYFKQQGYRVKSDQDVLFDDLAEPSVLILSENNRMYRMLIAGNPLSEGGCVIQAYTNPLNSKRAAVVFNARDQEEANLVYRKLFRYGNYSLLVFDQGKNRVEKTADVASGLIQDLAINATAVKTTSAQDIDILVQEVKDRRVIYVGESHTSYADHVLQFEIIRRLYREKGKLIIGMEMFQKPFQKYLDQYIWQQIAEDEFLKKTEYFTRWAYDYNLYRDILNFARTHEIPVIALNLRREITEKAAAHGLDSLTPAERGELPPELNMNNEAYREYLRDVYAQHEQSENKGFDNFYVSQLLWDATMAYSIADALQHYPGVQMVVLAGNGHLQYGWGIPDRVKRLTGESSAIALNDTGQVVERVLADFVLYAAPVAMPESPKLQVMLKKDKDAVVVEKVVKDGPAQKSGMKNGDILRVIDNKKINDIDDVKILLLDKKQGETLNVTVIRTQQDNKKQEMVLKVTL